ncbi:unnamed protein product, partial [Ilex paraguariensis]
MGTLANEQRGHWLCRRTSTDTRYQALVWDAVNEGEGIECHGQGQGHQASRVRAKVRALQERV